VLDTALAESLGVSPRRWQDAVPPIFRHPLSDRTAGGLAHA
jgi:hypothetical protein